MGARWYEPYLNRWISSDTIVPDYANPQSLNRYSYVLGNPVRYTDPTGHAACIDQECAQVVHPVTGETIIDTGFYQSHAERLFLEEMEQPVLEPDARLTNPFGGNNTRGGTGQHPAVDISSARGRGTPIYATNSGVVVTVVVTPKNGLGGESLYLPWRFAEA
jgi:murein DD-endopeptidase MepM/ murein hydrolase activator NlpD